MTKLPLSFLLIALPQFSAANSFLWQGDESRLWRDEKNWTLTTVGDPGNPPNSNDDVTLSPGEAGNNRTLSLRRSNGNSTTREINSLWIRGPGTWTFNDGKVRVLTSLSWSRQSLGATSVSLDGKISVTNGVTTRLVGNSSDQYNMTLNQHDEINGDGTLILNSDNHRYNIHVANPDFTGTFQVDSGRLILTDDDALTTASTIIVNGGTVELNTPTTTFPNLSGTGGMVDINTNSLTIAGGSTDFGGGFTGTGSLHKTSGSVWQLSGASTFSGDFTMDQGVLNLDNVNVLPNAHLTPSGNAAVRLLRDAKLGSLTGSGGSIRPLGNTLSILDQPDGTSSFTGELRGNGTLVFSPSGTTTEWTLDPDTSAHTFTGTIETHTGTLINNSSSLWDATVHVIGDDSFKTSTLSIIGGLSGTGNLALPGSLFFGRNDADTTYSGEVFRLGLGSLTKQGTGTWTFNGSTLNDWPVRILEGTLAGSSNIAGDLDVVAGAVLSPGTSPGTVIVGEDATVSGTYLYEIDGAASDFLNVGGVLDISSATLDIDLLSGGATQNVYLIASYGSLTGTFASVLDLPAGYVLDYAYNSNKIALAKNLAPNATSIVASSQQNAIFSVTFDRPVLNFDAFSDLIVTNQSGTASASGATISGSGANYTVQLTGLSGSGSLSLAVDTTSDVTNLYGLALSSSVTSSPISFDYLSPTATTITPSTTGPTNGTGLSFDVTFSEPVTGFDAFADLILAGTVTAQGANIAGSGNNYTVTLTGLSGDGTLTLAVDPSSNVIDAIGNPLSTSVTSAAITIDADPPTVSSLTRTSSSPTNFSTASFAVTFSEAVQNFQNAADLAVTTSGDAGYGSVTITDSGDATNFTITLNGITGTDGTLQVTLASGTDTTDLLGTALTASFLNAEVEIDQLDPVLTSILPETTGPTGASSLNFDLTFSEAITGLDTFSDLTLITTGTATATGASISGSDDTYQVTLSGVSGVGELQLQLALPSDLLDLAGNSLTQTLTSAPVTLSEGQVLSWLLEEGTGTTTTESISGLTNIATFQGVATWTTPVSPNSAHAVAVDNDNPASYLDAGTLKSDDSYVTGSDPDYKILSNNWAITAWIKLDATQSQSGDRSIISSDFHSNDGWLFFVRDQSIQENLGFDFGSSRIHSGISIPVDQAVFVAIIADDSGTTTGGGLSNHRFAVWDGSSWTYSDGTEISPIRLQGLELGSFNNGTRQFEGSLDEVRIFNQSLTQADLDSLVADTSPPSVTSITSAVTGPTNASSIDLGVTFRKPVINFDSFNDLIIGGVTATGASITGSGANYTVSLTGLSGNGDLTLAVDTASDIEDLSGLALAQSVTSNPITIDNTGPTLSLSPVSASPNAASLLNFELQFDEAVQNLTTDDFSLSFPGGIFSGASIATTRANTYQFQVTGVIGNGLFSLSLDPATDLTDLAGNSLATSSASASITLDQAGSTATITALTASPSTAFEAQFEIAFDEDVVNFDPADLDAAFSGTTSAPVITGSSSPYLITISNIVGAGTLTLSFDPSNNIADPLGNSLGACAANAAIDIDTLPPVPTLSLCPNEHSPTNESSVEFDLLFNKPINDLDNTDFQVRLAEVITNFPINVTNLVEHPGGITTAKITVTGISGDGQLELGFAPGQDITGDLGRSIINTTETVTVQIDNTAPLVQQFFAVTESPTQGNTLSFSLAFNESIPVIKESYLSITLAGLTYNNLTIIPGPGFFDYSFTFTEVEGTGSLELGIATPASITDLAGNSLASAPPTITIDRIAPLTYDDWAALYGLTSGIDDGLNNDPDGDDKSNLEEFAFDEHPLSGGTSGKRRLGIATNGTSEYLSLTIPVRRGAAFFGSPPNNTLEATIDNIRYRIEATFDLVTYNAPVIPTTEALSQGLPALDPGWEYHTFLLNAPLDVFQNGYFRVQLLDLSVPGP